MKDNFKLVLLVLWVQAVLGLFFTPVVELRQGRLRGLRSFSGQNRYLGIRYATAERFQPPVPPRKWNGTFYAVQQFHSCAQAIGILQLGDEDCLQLDVYTPGTASRGDALPVLIYFHGGSYYYGAKWHYDPEYLVKKNVIVVIVNYRVGVFGFLCLYNVANLGLKDQVAALLWIRQNIAAFGGDPDNVTMAGQSAGAASAAMHLLSRKSKGLFHKAILMSGGLTPWAFNPTPLSPTFQDVAKLGAAGNEYDVYNTLMKAPVHDILFATRGGTVDVRYFKYSPCVDSNNTDPFFHDTPYNIISSGNFNKVPLMIGFTDLEGVLFYGLNSKRSLEDFDKKFVDRLPSVFAWCSEEDKRQIAANIREHYFGHHRLSSKAAIKGVVDFYSDWIVYGTSDAFSKLLAQHSGQPVYNYMFSYKGDRNYATAFFNKGLGLKGVSHVDDVFHAFKPAGITVSLSDADRLLMEKFTTLLTNFMKFGDPTPVQTNLLPLRWPATTGNHSQLLRIDQQLSVLDTPASVRGDFFLSLLCEYGLPGYVPCESAARCNQR